MHLYLAGSPNNVVDIELLDKVPNANRLFTYLNTNAIRNYLAITKKGDADLAFNLYFAGTQNSETEEWLKEHKVNRLFSQLNDRSSIKEWVQLIRDKHRDAKLFIDSGAYTAHTLGRKIDCDEYIDYVNRLDDYITCFAQLDSIPGHFGETPTIQEILEAPEKSWQNYLYMIKHVKSPQKLIPVFHQGEDFKWLKTMVDYGVEYIGLSCRKDKDSSIWGPWFEQCFKVINASGRKDVKTHAFGLTAFKILESYPFYSSDSTTWIRASSNGTILTPFGVIYVSEAKSNDPWHIKHLDPSLRKKLEEYIESRGYTLEGVMTRYQTRMTFNASYMQDWANSYVYRGTGTVKKRLF